MDDLLPSYESVVDQNPWTLVARYLPSDDLCSAALVCQKWHEIFTPNLWGSPASHFGVQNDTVYVALTRFKRILPYVRPFVRELTHTLQFPPAHAEIYGGPHAEWLRDCLEYLPRLQCLIVDGLPFFDHASLLNLRNASLRRRSNRPNTFPVFSLRLLDASGCTNTTSTGLAEALPHFPDLVSLDLSRTPAAKDDVVLTNLKFLRNLRVLSLKSLGLRDADISIIARSIGTRVRSLDMSNNHLTDGSARLLLEYCMKEKVVEAHITRGPLPPVEHAQTGDSIDAFEMENLVGHLRRKLTEGFVGSLAIEEARDVGITHLYLSRNAMTVEGISGLLRSKRLQVLDIGILPAVLKNPTQTSSGEADSDLQLPGVAKLTSVLSEFASAKLKYLRVNYEVITEDALLEAVPSPRAELSGDLGRYAPSNAQELEAIEPPTPELDSTDTAIVELAGDSSYAVELPGSPTSNLPMARSSPKGAGAAAPIKALARTPTIEITSEPQLVKRGAAYAPEPVFVNPPLSPLSPILHSSGNETPLSSRNSLDVHRCRSSTSPASDFDASNSTAVVPGTRSRNNSTHYVEDRRARLDLRQSQENRLHPGMLPKVHTLVLTDVPAATRDREVINRLLQYIKDAAEEASIARQRARHTYIIPPGRSRAIAEREYARSLFALRRIVLEMEPPQAAPKKISTSWREYPTKSSTEDADSEAFWEAATHDFSFFGDEECGLPTHEPGRTLPLTAMSGLELAPRRTAPPPKPRIPESDFKPLLDVVGEIGKFRKERKAVFENLVRMGEVEPDVAGYWPGDITVVRKSADVDAGELDCYGNRYEAGWFYR
ncbi:Nn.00g035210.m01.CDS01 [Neocucurbitaria sp. VM-36]